MKNPKEGSIGVRVQLVLYDMPRTRERFRSYVVAHDYTFAVRAAWRRVAGVNVEQMLIQDLLDEMKGSWGRVPRVLAHDAWLPLRGISSPRTRIVLARTADALRALVSAITVEAEWGDVQVEGSWRTMGHHGLRSDEFPPCLADNCVVPPGNDEYIVGLSHVDLDCLGGVAAALSLKPYAPGFWEFAAFVDINGVHRIGESNADAVDVRRLMAFHAWSNAHRISIPRGEDTADVTAEVLEAIEVVTRIIRGDEALLKAGDEFAASLELLEATSYVGKVGDVWLRNARAFVNNLYTHDGVTGAAIAAYDERSGTVRFSLESPIAGVDCAKVAQSVFGPEAGGRAGIAGSPRGVRQVSCESTDQHYGRGSKCLHQNCALGAAARALAIAIAQAKGEPCPAYFGEMREHVDCFTCFHWGGTECGAAWHTPPPSGAKGESE